MKDEFVVWQAERRVETLIAYAHGHAQLLDECAETHNQLNGTRRDERSVGRDCKVNLNERMKLKLRVFV